MTAVDDALYRLESVALSLDAERMVGSAIDVRESVATVRDALQQARDENARLVDALDGMARAPYGEYAKAHERAKAAEAERDQWKEHNTEAYNRALAAEAEVRRMRELERITAPRLLTRAETAEAEVERLGEEIARLDEQIRRLADSPPDGNAP